MRLRFTESLESPDELDFSGGRMKGWSQGQGAIDACDIPEPDGSLTSGSGFIEDCIYGRRNIFGKDP